MSNLTKTMHTNSSGKTKERAKFAKKMFTVSEDAIIIRCVSMYGTNNWKLISQFLPGRSIRQLRERYNTYLKPGTLDTPWTPEEDLLLSEKVKEYGKHWKAISQFFKGRNQNNIKNRWNFHLKGGAALKTVNNEHINNETTNKNIIVDNLNSSNNKNEINNNINNSINDAHTSNNFINNSNSKNQMMVENKYINIRNDKLEQHDINNNNNLNIGKTNNEFKNNNIYNNNLNISPTISSIQENNQNSENNNKSESYLMPLFNQNSYKNDLQQITNTKTQNNSTTEVFNDEDFELYCSNVFSFQFDNSGNSEQSKAQKN